MKNSWKRLIAVLLTVVTLASVGVGAFAGKSSSYPEFDSIFVMGDSNAVGFGLDGYKGYFKKPERDMRYRYLLEGSFGQIVADELGILGEEKRTGMTYLASRSQDLLYFLGGNVKPDEWYNEVGRESWWQWAEEDMNLDGTGEYFKNRLKNGGDALVLMYAGASNVFFTPVSKVTSSGLSLDAESIGKLLVQLVEEMWNGYAEFLQYTEELIQYTLKTNPDCTLVLMGTFNPLKDLKITDTIETPVLNAFAVITELMNAQTEAWAKKYGCLYADISNMETASVEKELSITKMLSGDESLGPDFEIQEIYHGTREGYKYAARQILSVLETNKKPTTDIIVDLGSMTAVSSVSVDGVSIPMAKCSFDPKTHTLTVPYCRTNAKNLTVTGKREGDSRTCLAAYQLKWERTGYDAFQLYVTRDVSATVTNVVNNVVTVVKTVVSAISKLFKGR